MHPHIHLKDEESQDLTRLLNDILTEYTRPDYSGKAELLTAYLKILLIRICNLRENSLQHAINRNNNNYMLFFKFAEMLEKHYELNHEVLFYAEKLNVSSRKLAAACKDYSGRNPKELIEERILITAKRLLQFESDSIKEISSNLSFSDQFQFSKFFKKHTKLSPVNYREKFNQIKFTTNLLDPETYKNNPLLS